MFVGEPFHMVLLKGLKQYLNKNLCGKDMWKKYGKDIFAPIVAIKQDWRLLRALLFKQTFKSPFFKVKMKSKDKTSDEMGQSLCVVTTISSKYQTAFHLIDWI